APTHALGPAPAVELLDRLEHGDRPTVDRDRDAGLEGDGDLVRGREVEGRVLGVVVDVLGRRVPQVLEEPGLHRASPHVLVDREGRLLGDVDGDLVLLGELDRLLARPRVVANGGDHVEIRGESAEAHLEAHLIVALTGAAVADGRAAVLLGGLHQVLDDERPRDRGHQRVLAHIHAVGLDGGRAVVVGELVAGVHDDRLDGAAVQGTLPDDVHVLAALSQVDGHGDDLGPGLLPDPADGDGGVETAGVGEDDAIGHGVLLGALWVFTV